MIVATGLGTFGVVVAAYHYCTKLKLKPALDSKKFKPFKLIKKEEISHDTRRFTFALPTEDTRLGLPIGRHISLKFTDKDGNLVIRSYTPVTGNETPGIVTFVIKVYFPKPPRFPNGGRMSQHLNSLAIGDEMLMRGPTGHLTYTHKKFTVNRGKKGIDTKYVNHLGMIAGGTGITPMLQVISAIFRDVSDTGTTISLLYANVTEGDILVREELEGFAQRYPSRFRISYTLDQPSDGWKGYTGFVNEQMIRESLPAPGEGVHVLLCGPPPMLKYACFPNLEVIGFDLDHITKF